MPPASTWAKEEDAQLRQLVELHGPHKWSLISQNLGTKTSKQCRRRWKNHLGLNRKECVWTPEEDEQLLDGHRRHGNKWTAIAREIGGRTDNAVKNRFTILRKRKLVEELQPPERQPRRTHRRTQLNDQEPSWHGQMPQQQQLEAEHSHQQLLQEQQEALMGDDSAGDDDWCYRHPQHSQRPPQHQHQQPAQGGGGVAPAGSRPLSGQHNRQGLLGVQGRQEAPRTERLALMRGSSGGWLQDAPQGHHHHQQQQQHPGDAGQLREPDVAAELQSMGFKPYSGVTSAAQAGAALLRRLPELVIPEAPCGQRQARDTQPGGAAGQSATAAAAAAAGDAAAAAGQPWQPGRDAADPAPPQASSRTRTPGHDQLPSSSSRALLASPEDLGSDIADLWNFLCGPTPNTSRQQAAAPWQLQQPERAAGSLATPAASSAAAAAAAMAAAAAAAAQQFHSAALSQQQQQLREEQEWQRSREEQEEREAALQLKRLYQQELPEQLLLRSDPAPLKREAAAAAAGAPGVALLHQQQQWQQQWSHEPCEWQAPAPWQQQQQQQQYPQQAQWMQQQQLQAPQQQLWHQEWHSQQPQALLSQSQQLQSPPQQQLLPNHFLQQVQFATPAAAWAQMHAT